MPCTPVDGVGELRGPRLTAGVPIVTKRAPAELHGLSEDGADRLGQGGEAVGREPPGDRAGVDAGAKERFISVDVADAGEHTLIEQHGLDRALGVAAGVDEMLWLGDEGVGAKFTPVVSAKRIERWVARDATESARVDEVDAGVVVECPRRVGVLGGVGGVDRDGAGHTQLQDTGAMIVGDERELLAEAFETDDAGGFEEVPPRGAAGLVADDAEVVSTHLGASDHPPE